MSKKTHWKEFSNNDLSNFYNTDPEKKTAYNKRMFKWGLKLDKMPINKPKIKKVKKLPTENEEE